MISISIEQEKQENFEDLVVIGLNLPKGEKIMDVSKLFKDGDRLLDAYSGITTTVQDGKAKINSNYDIVLLEKSFR